MNKKTYLVLGIVVFACIVIAAIYGVRHKNTEDILSDDLSKVTVTEFHEEASYLVEIDGDFEKELLNSPIVLKVEAVAEPEYDYQSCVQNVKINKVFKGEDIVKEGMEVKIIRDNFSIWKDNHISMFFCNFMKVGEEYMIFCSELVDTKLYDDTLLRIDGYALTPIFKYKDVENKIFKVGESGAVANEESIEVPYSIVKDNEFFVSSEELLQKMLDFKHDIMKKIDSNYAYEIN